MVLHNWVIKVILSHIIKYNMWYKSVKIQNATIIKINYKNWNFSLII
jgi:broad specificity phosphatase PhoE